MALRRRTVLSLMAVVILFALTLPPGTPQADDPPTTDGRTGWIGDGIGPASPGPDLNATAGDITLSDTTPRHGQSVTLTLHVRNTGSEDALNVSVDVYDGDDVTGTLVKSFLVQTSGAGSSTQLVAMWTATLGDHSISMYLDTDDNVTEDSESNNHASRSVTVAGSPDLRLEDGAFLLSSHLQGSITLTADAINGGSGAASGYSLGFYTGDPDAGGTLIGRRPLSNIPSGGRATASQVWSATAGQHHLYARLENTDVLDPSGNDQVDRVVLVGGLVVARAGPDQAATADVYISFNGSGSWSEGGSIINYTWDMGDGTTAYGAVVSHNYTNTGSTVRVVTVKLTVRDSLGRTDSDTARAYINPAGSSPPTANAGTAPSGRTYESLDFDGSGSTGTISSYIWDFGDGSGGTCATVSHSYLDDGTYAVSLVTLSSDSLADADAIAVTVSNRAPVTEAIPDITTDVGVSHDLLVLAYDMDGHITSYRWDFDDGQTSNVRDPTHTWYSDGSHTVTVNVTDDDGDHTIVSFMVNVTNVLPVADFDVNPIADEDDRVYVDASDTVEPGDDIVSWEWDWDGDGTFDNTTGPMSYYVYGRPGYFNITLRVTDGEGTTNETVRQVMIRNIAPTASARVSPNSNMEGLEIEFNATTSREPGDDIIGYSWDFDDDGVYELVNITQPVVRRSFNSTGMFYARLLVWDEDGTSDDYRSYWTRYTVQNSPPVVYDSETNGKEGEVTVVHADVFEPGMDLVSFSWDFDLDGEEDARTNVSYVNNTWWSSGKFEVWVTVTDEDDTPTSPSWGAGSCFVNISDVAPEPYVDGGRATEGEPVEITVELVGTERNISKYMLDLDNDGTYEVVSDTPEIMVTFTKTQKVNCSVKVIDTDGTEGVSLFSMVVNDVAPTLTGPPFMVVEEGRELTVTVTPHEPGNDIVRFEWDWEANGLHVEETEEPTASYIYVTPGAKRLKVTVYDIDGSSGTVYLQVMVANALPSAKITPPGQPMEGEAINLSANMSTEPGGHIVSYEWDYDGDGLFDHVTREPWHFHAWDAPGKYNLILRVIDADGTFDEAMVQVEVTNVEPEASLKVTIHPEDTPSVLDGSDSYDPGGIVRYEWNVSTATLTELFTTTTPQLEYAFDRKVRYDITLTVTDGEGSTAVTQIIVAKEDVITLPPTVTWQAPSSAREGDVVTFRAWAEDPYPDDESLQDIRYIEFRWEFGDGVFGEGDTVTHVYGKARATGVKVTLTVIDEDNDRTVVEVANLTIENPPPVVQPADAIFVKAGEEGSTTIVATDATTEEGEMAYALAGNAPEWATLDGNRLVVNPPDDAQSATYMITVRVIDVLGSETPVQVPVVVTMEEVEEGVTWGALMGLLIVVLVLAVVISVVLSRRMRPPPARVVEGGPKEEGTEYDGLFGEPRRKVRAVAKVEPEHVDVDYGAEEEQALVASAVAAGTPPPDLPDRATEAREEEEPPLPSWMAPRETEPEPGEVRLEEREVEAPPAAPEDWSRPTRADRPYSFRRGAEGEGARSYKGARPPRR